MGGELIERGVDEDSFDKNWKGAKRRAKKKKGYNPHQWSSSAYEKSKKSWVLCSYEKRAAPPGRIKHGVLCNVVEAIRAGNAISQHMLNLFIQRYHGTPKKETSFPGSKFDDAVRDGALQQLCFTVAAWDIKTIDCCKL